MKRTYARGSMAVGLLVCCAVQTGAQTPAAARKPQSSVTNGAAHSSAPKPPAPKKLTFGEDTFTAKRKLLDSRAQSLTAAELATAKQAAADGAPDSMYLLGANSLHGGDEAAAKQWWSQAAEKDYLFAMVALGELASTDATEKRRLFEKAAASGAPPAELRLAELMLASPDGPQGIAEGKKLILKSAQDGCVEAMNLVGASYLGLSAKYPALFEANPTLGQQYLQAAKSAHSEEARNTLRLAVEKGILPDPFRGKPQLDSGDAFISYLHQLDSNDRVFYLRQQLAKYPQSPLRTKALEEVLWLSPDPASQPEFETLKKEAPDNLTAQTFSLQARINRMLGHPAVHGDGAEIKSVPDVLNHWKQATGFDRVLARSFVLANETITVAGDDNLHKSYCATDGKNVRRENLFDYNTLAAKGGVYQFYFPLDDYQNFKSFKAAPKSDNQIAYLGNCLNLPHSLQWPEDFKYEGLKTFLGIPAYALLSTADGSEDYFDSTSFFYLGNIGAKGASTTNYFGYRDFGGAVLPQYRLYHQGNNIRLAKIDAVQWDTPPAVDTDVFVLAFSQMNGYPVLKPILQGTIKQNELEQQIPAAQQELEKLSAVGGGAFGLDLGAQKDRGTALSRMQAETASIDDKNREWEQVGTAVYTAVVQHDRERRFKKPVGAVDIYLNWHDVSNLDDLLHHKSIRVEQKQSYSGQNATMGYCAMDDQGNRRSEGVGNFLDVQNRDRQASFDLQKRTVSSHFEFKDTPLESQIRNNLGRCLIGVNEGLMIYSSLSKSRSGTGTLNKRDSYVIMIPDPDGADGMYYFFDKETFMLLGHKYHKDGEPISYYDFRQVGQAIIPFKEYEFHGGQYPDDSIRSIEKLDLDQPIDAKEFAIDPPIYANLHATTLKEKRPELYKTGGSAWGALLTGALMGVAGAGADSPILQAGNQQAAQLRALGNQLAARQASQNISKFAANSFSTKVPSFSSPAMATPQFVPVLDKVQLQMLQGLVLANSSDGNGQDSTSALLIGVLQGLAAQNSSPILDTANQQAAALRAIGDANAAKQQQAAQGRLAAEQAARQAAEQKAQAQQAAQQATLKAQQEAQAQQAAQAHQATNTGSSLSSGTSSSKACPAVQPRAAQPSEDPVWGSWTYIATTGVAFGVSRVNNTTLTWRFFNGGPQKITSMNFTYTYVDADTGQTTTSKDILVFPLKPGGIFGGWTAYTANTRGNMSITITDMTCE
jgi:hypothetical protein